VQQGHAKSARQCPSRGKQSNETSVSTAVYDWDFRAEVCLTPTY